MQPTSPEPRSLEGARSGEEEESATRPLVSIAVPTYNRAHLLPRALESLRAQRYPALEILVSDNGSSDDTPAVIAAASAGDPRVRGVRNAQNVGPTENFNRSRAACRGAVVGWLGDDDRLDPDYVACCVAALEADPGVVLATGRIVYEDDAGPVYEGRRVEVDDPDPVRRVLDYLGAVKDNGTFYGLTPRWAADAVSPMRAEMANDFVLLAELAFLGRFRTVDAVAVHRRVGGSTTSLFNVARVAGFPRWQGLVPQLAIAWTVGTHLAWRSPVLIFGPSPPEKRQIG